MAMNNKLLMFEQPFKVLLWTLGLLALLFLLLEGWRYANKPTLANNTAALHQSLDTATKLFYHHQGHFREQSKELSYSLQSQLQEEYSVQKLYSIIQNYPSFWGTVLAREHEPIVWRGFSMDSLPDGTAPQADSATVSIRKQNNVLFWFCDISFTVEDTTGNVSYQLYTSRLIEQDNALPIKGNSEYNLIDQISDELSYPVELSIFNPSREEGSIYTVIKNSRQDSIGVFYASPAEFDTAINEWKEHTDLWRSVFLVFCFICLSLFVYLWLDWLPNLWGLLFQLIIVGFGWLVFDLSDIPARWIPDVIPETISQDALANYQALCNYLTDSIFAFLAAFTLNRKANRQAVFIRSRWYPFRIFIAGLIGFINAGLILLIIYKGYNFAVHSQMSLLGLQLMPPSDTLLFFLGLGLTIYSLGLALTAINRLILRSGKDQHKLMSVIVTISFVLGLTLAQLFLPEAMILNWAFFLALAIFSAVFGIAYLYKTSPRLINNVSTLRTIAIGSFLIAMAGITLIYRAYLERQDHSLYDIARSYTVSEDPFARMLTTNLLNELNNQFAGLEAEDLNSQIPFVQTRLTQTIEQELSPLSRKGYSIDVHLINATGKSVADYSTDLNSPDWVSIFDLRNLRAAIRVEQIDKSTNRPIVQHPEIVTQRKYKTFYRGWIPVFNETSDDPIAWILCSVYNERPDYDKPIRAVMASLTYDDVNKSFQLLSYRDGNLIGSDHQGVTTHFPTFNTLLESEHEALRQDTLVFYSSEGAERSYRNILLKIEEGYVIKVSTIAPDFRNILFSFFRFNFIMLFAGILSKLLSNITRFQNITLLGKNDRFQDRISDNFLVATLVFLALLVVATHIAIKDQNKNIVRQELFEKLDRLAQAIKRNEEFQANYTLPSKFLLDSLTTQLSVDASFYNHRMVSESTTPQIYQQHILPSSLPFTVYQDLYVRYQRETISNITLGNQEFLIGYCSVFSRDNEPVAVVAIPTFVHSPKYDQQLLETTSYLIILYFFVFGLFIIGAALISKQLTRPLHFIQEGLNEISQGNLDTTIPVTSQDEIGSLASAYNEMVYRLKELQTELAKAERESAWKEMAQQVAHEIKNPLTPMKLSIQHLERQLASDQYDPKELKPRIKKITENIIEQIQSLNSIASDFSKFSKPVEEEFTDVPVNEILNSVTDLYRHDKQVEIRTELPSHSIIVKGVADELRRVIINLVKNAYEAMSAGGTITLRTYRKGNSVFMEVEDNGQGIREEDKSKIFVPNFSTKSSGTGLGLAICKKIVQAHEGSISFASIEGKGTTFVVKLPVSQDPEVTYTS